MKNAFRLLVLTALYGNILAQNENDPTGMGMERVARLFTEVYTSPRAESNQAIRWVQIDLGESKNIEAVSLYPKVRAWGVAVSEGFPDPFDKVCTFEVDNSLGSIKKRYVRIMASRWSDDFRDGSI